MKRKAVSPVIATVMLIAVAITVSVAAAYWMGEIISRETTIQERAEISYLTYGFESGDPENIIVPRIVNTGTVTLNITDVFVNGLEKDFSGENMIEPGEESILIVYNVGWVSQEEYHTVIQTANESLFIKDTIAP